MASYYVSEVYKTSFKNEHTAAEKARKDADAFFADFGLGRITVVQSVSEVLVSSSPLKKLARRVSSLGDWKKGLDCLKAGDRVYIQYPIKNHSVRTVKYLCGLVQSGVSICLLVHDLESFRKSLSDRALSLKVREMLTEESLLVQECSSLILHNESMRRRVRSLFGEAAYEKSLSLDCFDYLIPVEISEKMFKSEFRQTGSVVIAGNLSPEKAGYVYHLPDDIHFVLYGVGYEEGARRDNVEYAGVFSPEELPLHLEGDFGLVWDGPSSKTCEGVYGDYTRINCPHKASLYLACGIPVVVWSEAAISTFIVQNKLGIAVNSLEVLSDRIRRLSEEEYLYLKDNAVSFSQKLAKGFHMKKVLAVLEDSAGAQ